MREGRLSERSAHEELSLEGRRRCGKACLCCVLGSNMRRNWPRYMYVTPQGTGVILPCPALYTTESLMEADSLAVVRNWSGWIVGARRASRKDISSALFLM